MNYKAGDKLMAEDEISVLLEQKPIGDDLTAEQTEAVIAANKKALEAALVFLAGQPEVFVAESKELSEFNQALTQE
jgi:hypothetical protein